MVAIRKKVGARGFLRSKPLAKGKRVIKIDFSVPAQDGIFDADIINAFEQYFQQNVKLHGKKGKLGDKVKVALDKNNALTITTVMKYKKGYFKYLTKKFLKKKELRDWLRVLAVSKGAYTLKYYNIQEQDE